MIKNFDQLMTLLVSAFMALTSIRILIGSLMSFENKSTLFHTFQYLANYLDDEDE